MQLMQWRNQQMREAKADTSPLNGWRIYLRYILISIRGQMQYRLSFFLSSLGQFLGSGIEVLGMWALFSRFGMLEQWTFAQVCFFYGIVNVAFAIADALSTGFDMFGNIYVKTGDFDRLLVRPRSIVLQLAGHELALRRVGRLLQGVIVFLWACFQLNIAWSAATVTLLFFTIVGGVGLFFGLFVLQATLSFWTIESLEIMNTLTYGGVQTAQYPLAIYASWFRKFFIFVVPLGCVTYFPILAILRIDDSLGSPLWFQWFSPLAGFAFFFISLIFFRLGVRHYTSTGS